MRPAEEAAEGIGFSRCAVTALLWLVSLRPAAVSRER
jgi:hypothetical protein